MRQHDLPEIFISGCDAVYQSAYMDYIEELLGYGPNLRALFNAADAAPDCAMLNANAAILHLAFEGVEGWQDAAPYLKKMEAAAQYPLPQEEALFCAATRAWAHMDFYKSMLLFEEVAEIRPYDLVAIKWGQYHAFNLGDQDRLYKLGKMAVDALPGKAFVHGLYAFGLEQTHQLHDAETHARQAMEIAIDDAWAHHALAHVMETENRAAEGLQWMKSCAHFWDQKGTFIREHNYWHKALFHLRLGQSSDALDVFDQKIWGTWPEFPQEIIGASSLLWRMELNGIDAGARWQPVLEKSRERCDDRIFGFHDLHYLFALSRAGDMAEAEQHVVNMQQHATCLCPQNMSHANKCWQKAALPAAKGVLAFAQGKYDDAVDHLSIAAPHLHYIGGSHAQRDIFDQTLNTAKARIRDQKSATIHILN